MMRAGENILADLAAPGRLLIFVDDSGTSGKPLPDLATDFELLCGVAIPSERYPRLRANLAADLAAVSPQVEEFHATEIVNPGARSVWSRVPINTRVRVLNRLVDMIEDSAQRIFYCYVSGEQCRGEMMSKIEARGIGALDHKKALHKVFFNAVLQHVQTERINTAIVVDSSTPLPNALKIQAVVDPQGIYEDGIIYVDSRVEVGLQLADLAAYLVNRIHHTRQRLIDGKRGPFDELVIDLVSRLSPLLVNVLDQIGGAVPPSSAGRT
jgi:hypothetical protein